VQTVGLHQGRVQRNPFKNEWHQRNVVALRQVDVELAKTLSVCATVVDRQLHTQQQDLGTGLAAALYHVRQVGSRAGQRLAAQPVIGAQLD